jgi:hypothetical protein
MTHVIIPDYPTRVQFTVGATPTTGPWAFNFTFFATGDIDVYFGTTLMTEGTHYTVTGNPGREGGFEGGSVSAVAAISNTTVTVQRVLPLERMSDFPVAGSFNRQTLNNTLDKHVAMIQQVDERVDRAFVSPPSSPPLVLVANYFPRVNAAATGMELIAPTQVRTEIAAQPLDATLTALAGLVTAADKVIYATGPDAFALATLTAYARTILDDLDAIAARATLGLGTMATQNANAVNITGGSISGVAVAVPGLGTMSTQNANAVNITGGTITGMPTPVNPFDVATKNYADNLAFGVNKRSTVRAASTTNVLISGVIGGTTLDGVVLASGDRVLFKDQTNHAQNGVYLVGPLTTNQRAADFDTYDECPGSLVTIQEGTVNQDTVYLCTSNAGGILDTTPIDFSKVKVSPNIPVVIAEGGTGQTTAPTAFDALKQPASTAYVGAVQLATQAEVNAGVDALKAVVPATLATRLTAVVVRHDCRFDYISTTTCRLTRYGGALITIDAQLRTIPAAGVDLAYVGTYNTNGLGLRLRSHERQRDAALRRCKRTGHRSARRQLSPSRQPGLDVRRWFLWHHHLSSGSQRYRCYLGVEPSRPSGGDCSFGRCDGSTVAVFLTQAIVIATFGEDPITAQLAGFVTNSGGTTSNVTDVYSDGSPIGAVTLSHNAGVGYGNNCATGWTILAAPGVRSIAARLCRR